MTFRDYKRLSNAVDGIRGLCRWQNGRLDVSKSGIDFVADRLREVAVSPEAVRHLVAAIEALHDTDAAIGGLDVDIKQRSGEGA